mmetsp:Transcript_3270/g.7238  ORF Transcript_3270/g.7238 Transcript_3270/m.7238 type:complete len:84 (-) Transcript_3270:671-922(-)
MDDVAFWMRNTVNSFRKGFDVHTSPQDHTHTVLQNDKIQLPIDEQSSIWVRDESGPPIASSPIDVLPYQEYMLVFACATGTFA